MKSRYIMAAIGGSGSGSQAGGPLDIRRMKSRGNRPKRGSASEIYQTWLEVHAEKAFEGLGIHSGTITHVKMIDENGSWIGVLDEKTCNHGACPGEGSMELRYVCAPHVVTRDWYGFDGECAHDWPDHLCDDDTALQINNAFWLPPLAPRCALD